ncbi:sensor histidine kinase [soil metagenome]
MTLVGNRDFWLWSLAVIAFILNAALGSYNIDNMVDTQSIVTRTRLVQTEFISLLSDMKDAETGHRGYLLTGQSEYLLPFQQSLKDFEGHSASLQALTNDNPLQRDRLISLHDLIDKKYEEMKRTIAVREQTDLTTAAQDIMKGEGKAIMDRIREIVGEALVTEVELQKTRQRDANHQIFIARVITFAAASLAIVIILIAAAVNHNELRRRIKANEALVATKARLEVVHEAVQKSELQYRTLADHFEKQVEDRTAELQTQSLLLKSSNEELEKFAYIASHDLQEPLRKIQAFGDRLLKRQRDRLEPEGQDAIDRMLDAAGRMRRLIEDLLAFSRVSSNIKPFEPVSLNVVLAEVVATFEVRIEQAAARVVVEVLPTVLGDESQLRQLFQNLIGNSFKFAKPGVPPEIRIDAIAFADLPLECDPAPPSGEGRRVTVTDNGIGFEQQYADRIFELFQRLHNRSHSDGTGLGLAICKKIATRHGIILQVRSRPGEGTVFSLDWPQRSD